MYCQEGIWDVYPETHLVTISVGQYDVILSIHISKISEKSGLFMLNLLRFQSFMIVITSFLELAMARCFEGGNKIKSRTAREKACIF